MKHTFNKRSHALLTFRRNSLTVCGKINAACLAFLLVFLISLSFAKVNISPKSIEVVQIKLLKDESAFFFVRMLANNQNKPVAEFTVTVNNIIMAYFLDVSNNQRINDAKQAMELAQSREAEEVFLGKQKLKLFDAENQSSTKIKQSEFDAPMCQWPYSGFTSWSHNGDNSVIFLFKLESSHTEKILTWCDNNSIANKLTLDYYDQIPFVFLINSDSLLFAFRDRPVILILNKDVHQLDAKLGDNIYIISKESSESYYSMMSKKKLSPQDAVNSLEKTIAGLQMFERLEDEQ